MVRSPTLSSASTRGSAWKNTSRPSSSTIPCPSRKPTISRKSSGSYRHRSHFNPKPAQMLSPLLRGRLSVSWGRCHGQGGHRRDHGDYRDAPRLGTRNPSRRSERGTKGGCVHRRLRYDNAWVTGSICPRPAGVLLLRPRYPPRQPVPWFSPKPQPKNIAVRGTHWQHEPCWYAVRRGRTGHWMGDRKQSTLWSLSHNKNDTGHGTQKPVEAMRRQCKSRSSGLRALLRLRDQPDCCRDLRAGVPCPGDRSTVRGSRPTGAGRPFPGTEPYWKGPI